jgi:hypothetical protein
MLNEDTLVQHTTAKYLCDGLGWEPEYAHNVVREKMNLSMESRARN